MKKCSMCKEIKESSEFNKATSTADGLQRGCKRCKADKYLQNTGKYKESSRAARKRRYDKLKEIKSNRPCVDCKITYPYYVMDFDHLGDKTNSISNLMVRTSWDNILKEIEKCELICANCHRKRTWQRSNIVI